MPLPLGTESSEPETFAHQNTKPPFTLGELMRHQEEKKKEKKDKNSLWPFGCSRPCDANPTASVGGGRDF